VLQPGIGRAPTQMPSPPARRRRYTGSRKNRMMPTPPKQISGSRRRTRAA
jgi:hypothetical protein